MKTRTGQVSFGYFPSHLDGYVFRSVIGKMWTPFSQVMGTLKAFSDALCATKKTQEGVKHLQLF